MQPEENTTIEGRAIDLAIKLLLVAILIAWSTMIVFPFITPVLWGVILAITLYPLYKKLLKFMRGKNGLASSLFTLLLLAILLVPSILLISAVVSELKEAKASMDAGSFTIPPPNPKVADWPLVGQRIYDTWSALNSNLEAAIISYREELIEIGQKFLAALKGFISNIVSFSLSILIMGVLLAYHESVIHSIGVFMKRLLGSKSEEYTRVISQTVRNVAKGILGVAFIQFLIMGACFALADVPLAGLWALLVFLLALVQLPGALVAIPVIMYIWSVKDPLPATIWTIILLIAGLSDNVLKPLLMGKGAPVPMLIIFLGAIGGFILSGFVGMFTGAIVLSLFYKLSGLWMHGSQPDASVKNE